ncbi:MAG: DUF333 domain-containing protein [Alphaproteobacteria bacterium]|nr:DUF333 domain-containing protein [Alphaproteobacteria bacterium]
MYRALTALLTMLLLAACQDNGTMSPPSQSGTKMANPASVNCVEKGGKLDIETAGDGGQYGVCLFEDNRQCEEWALLRGECPDGGIKVTGYVTPAGRYCAIRGGVYSVTKEQGADGEQGNCRIPGGTVCDAQAYYDGTCP